MAADSAPTRNRHLARSTVIVMAAFGVVVLTQAVYKAFHPEVPVVEIIGGIGLLALAANCLCLGLLWSHREDDINMSSVWLCSRNDIIANVSVLVAAAGVWMLHSSWPDVVVGTVLAVLFFKSSVTVIRDARRELRMARDLSALSAQALSLAVPVALPRSQ